MVDGPHLVRPEAGDELHVDTDGSIGGFISQVGHVRPAVSLSHLTHAPHLLITNTVPLPAQEPCKDAGLALESGRGM